jgi:cation transport ATPase
MIVTDKVIRLEVTRPFDKSALARILELVQNAAERKAPAELFIRKFARVYTPIVIILAVLIVLSPFVYSLINPAFVFTFNDWLYRALVFLVISCPCALVVSIPLGYFGGIGAASRLGILFKGGNYLDAITKINTVVFDKTGTLTKGTFEVQACKSAGEVSEEELVKLVASVESDSTHPIAKAVVNYAKERFKTEVTTTPEGAIEIFDVCFFTIWIERRQHFLQHHRIMFRREFNRKLDLRRDDFFSTFNFFAGARLIFFHRAALCRGEFLFQGMNNSIERQEALL